MIPVVVASRESESHANDWGKCWNVCEYDMTHIDTCAMKRDLETPMNHKQDD